MLPAEQPSLRLGPGQGPKAEQGRRGRGWGKCHWEVPRKGREFQRREQDVWSLQLQGRGRAGGQGGRGWSGRYSTRGGGGFMLTSPLPEATQRGGAWQLGGPQGRPPQSDRVPAPAPPPPRPGGCPPSSSCLPPTGHPGAHTSGPALSPGQPCVRQGHTSGTHTDHL